MHELPPVSSPELDAFVPLVRAFAALIEKAREEEPAVMLTRGHFLIAQLYATALKLPSTDILFAGREDEPEDDDNPIPQFVHDPDHGDQEEWSQLYHGLGRKFGKWNYYREVFDPYKPTTEAEVTGSLADDFADIYRDLRSGLRKWDRGDTGGALWEWRFGLENHWGEHATGSLRSLHTLATDYETGWPATRAGAA
jgi:hypothetical protein